MIDGMRTLFAVYQHYKGDLYRVLLVAWESTNGRPREKVVVYVSLKKGNINVRRQEEFHELVETDRGPVPRFTYYRRSDDLEV